MDISDILHQVFSDSVIVAGLSKLKTFDEYTYEHSVDVCVSSIQLGETYYYSYDNLIRLAKAAVLHDIGKLRVPIEILNSPNKLTQTEWVRMKMHPVYSAEWVLDNLGDKQIATAVLMHHERVNGDGYPLGLNGSQLTMDSRIIAVADIYNALKTKRTYRNTIWEDDRIYNEFKQMQGVDLHVVDEFYKILT